MRSDIALDKGCKLANHPDIMLELQREKAATTQLVLLKEQLSNIYSNITITGRRSHTHTHTHTHTQIRLFCASRANKHVVHVHTAQSGLCGSCTFMHTHTCTHARFKACQCKPSAFRMTNVICKGGMWGWMEECSSRG